MFLRELTDCENNAVRKEISFDSSQPCVGWVMRHRDARGGLTPLCGGSVDISHFGFGTDSSWQNTA
jgi:hypothetical protein